MGHYMAGGSTVGRAHALAERPNQDAFCLLQGEWGAVAVVCDGCGSEPGSGTGAVLGASLTARAVARQLRAASALDLATLREEILAGLSLVAGIAGIGIREHLLFTIVGSVLSADRAFVFACGDGVIALDGTVRTLGPFPDNAPPYLAYGLMGGSVAFELLHDGPAREVFIGTDGAAEAPLSSWSGDERFFANPDLLRRRLKLARPSDDATVAIIARRPL
jgi:hypothetical protein